MSATINVFNSAFNNDYKTIIVEDNKTISSSIKLDFENCLISVNGNKCDENYILKENDIVTIRQFPSNDTAVTVANWVLDPLGSLIVGATTGHWEGTALGLKNVAIEAIADLFKQDNKTTGTTEKIPTISGAKNQSGAGKVIPFVIGESMYTPIYAAQAYTDIDPNDGTDGENQYLHALFCLGYNNIDLRKVSLGIYPLSVDRQNGTSSKSLDCSNSEEKNTVHYKLSLYQQELELRQHGEEVNLFPQKVVQENFNTELIHPEGANALVVQPFSAKYPQKIQIEIQFQNLVKYDDNGDMTENSVEIGCAYSLDGGATYKPFNAFYAKKSDIKITDKGNNDFGNNKGQYKVTEFKGTKNKAMRFVAEKTFTYDEVFNTATITRLKNNAIEFKIFRVSEDKSESNSKLQYKVYFSSIRTWCYDYNATYNSAYDNTGTKSLVPQIPIIKKYKDITARLGFKIKAGDELSGQIDELNVVLCSRARYCTITKENGEKIYTWSAVDDTVPTNNPAALALMVLQHTMRGEYAYKDSQIDMDSFGRFYEWCNSVDNELINSDCHRYIANGVLSKELKTSELVNQILACGHGKLVLNGNKYGVWFDRPQSTPVMILNSQNVLEASNSKSFSEDIDGYSAKFIDCLNDYQEDTIVCVPKNTTKNDSEYRLENIEIPWITDAARVYRHCMYNIACRRLRAETWTRKLGVDGNLIEIGNLVVVQDDTIAVGIGEGAEIKSVSVSGSYIKSITVDYPFAVSDITKTYGVKIQHSDRIYGVKVVTYEVAKFSKIGEYSVLTFNGNGISLNEIIVPTIGDIVAFGIFNRITTDALCFGKKDNGDGTFTLTLVPYQKGIYDAESGTIPKFISNVTSPKENGSKLSEELPSPTYKDVKEIAGNLISNIGLDTTPPTAPVLTNVSADNDGNITLVWNGSTDNKSGVSEYFIYHKTVGRFVRIQTIPHDNNSQAQYTFIHNTSEKFTTHYYYVTAKDKMNNESEPSETLSIENPVKTKPYEPKALKAMAMRDYIRLEWTCEQSTNASLNPRLFKVEIKRNDTDEWESVGEYSSRETLYYFDRSKDGYSEADKISKYQFRVKSVSVYGLESEYCTSESVNVDNYLGWKIGDIEISSYATEGTLFIKASVKGSSYGDKFLNVKYGDEIVAENSLAGRMFYVKLNGYQEVSDITSKDIYVECYSVADNVSKTLAGSSIDTSLYKTYKITKPSVTAYADKQGIHISWSDNTSDYYLKPAYKLTIDGKEVLSAADTLDYNWLFAENTYPTKAEVLAHKIILSVSTAADSVEISDIATDISVFKGWIPDVPDIKLSVSGRTVPVSWNIQSDNVYDFLGCELQVAKGYKVTAGKYSVITDESELEWFAPALGLNPYDSLENYKKGDKDGYLSVKGSSVAFSVPLFGQDNDGAMNTMYVYRARAFTKGGKSEWSDAYFIEVKPVSAYDVVKAWNINDSGEKVKIDGALGANQIFVNELSAICANLGYITDGALQTDSFNYWAVNDTPMKDGTILPKGSFRVGGANDYLEVTPILDSNGVATGDYNLTIVAKKFTTTTNVTILNNKLFLVRDADGNILFKAGVYEKNPDAIDDYGLVDGDDKNYIRVNEGYYTSKSLRVAGEYQLMSKEVFEGPIQIFNRYSGYIFGTSQCVDYFDGKVYYAAPSPAMFSKSLYDPYFISDKNGFDIYSIDKNGDVKKELLIHNYPFTNDKNSAPFNALSIYKGKIYYFGIYFNEEGTTPEVRVYITDIKEKTSISYSIPALIQKIAELFGLKDSNFVMYDLNSVFTLSMFDNYGLAKIKKTVYTFTKESSSSYFVLGEIYYDSNGNKVYVTKDTYKSGTYYTRSQSVEYEKYLINLDNISKVAYLSEDAFGDTVIGWTSDDDYLYFISAYSFVNLITRIKKDSLVVDYCSVRVSGELPLEGDNIGGAFALADFSMFAKNKRLKLIHGTLTFVGTYAAVKEKDDGTLERMIYSGIFEIRNPIWFNDFNNPEISTISIYGEYQGDSVKFKRPYPNDQYNFLSKCYPDKNIYTALATDSQDRIFASIVTPEDDYLTSVTASIYTLEKKDGNAESFKFIEILGTIKETEIKTNFNKLPYRGIQVLNIKQLSETDFFVYYTNESVLSSFMSDGCTLGNIEEPAGNVLPEKLFAAIFNTEDNFITTQKRAYETGIGFSGFYKDLASKNYRYLLASGAYLEFDKDGKLVTDNRGPKGDAGSRGDKGEKGDKGDTGETGTSITKVEQIESSNLPNGINRLEITMSDGSKSEFSVKNGAVGDDDIVLTDDDFNDIMK